MSMIHSGPDFLAFTLGMVVNNYSFSITNILISLSEYLKNLNMSVESIQKIRNAYAEDLWEEYGTDDPLKINEITQKENIHIQSLSDDQIRELCRDIFNPSQMAIVITGGFDSANFREELENSLGQIPGREISNPFPSEKIPETVAVRTELSIDDLDAPYEDLVGYEYNYFVASNFKCHVMKDLFRMIGLE